MERKKSQNERNILGGKNLEPSLKKKKAFFIPSTTNHS